MQSQSLPFTSFQSCIFWYQIQCHWRTWEGCLACSPHPHRRQSSLGMTIANQFCLMGKLVSSFGIHLDKAWLEAQQRPKLSRQNLSRASCHSELQTWPWIQKKIRTWKRNHAGRVWHSNLSSRLSCSGLKQVCIRQSSLFKIQLVVSSLQAN